MKKIVRIISTLLSTMLILATLAACGSAPVQPQAPTSGDTKAAVSSESQTKEVQKPETVSIGYFTGNDDNVLVKEKGWLEEDLSKLGVKVKWVNFQAGRDMNNAMLAKSIDFAGGIGDPPVTIAVSTKIPYEVIWISNVIADSEALVVKNKANVNSIKDLKGKKIATTVSSTSQYSLLSALEINGLKAEDVKIIDLTPPDIVAAWQRGDIDAAYTWEPNLSKISADGKKLISSKEVADAGAPTSAYDIVRSEFAQKCPDIVELFLKELIKAHELYKNNPDDAAAIWGKANSIDKADALKQAKGNTWLTPEEELSSKFLGTSSKIGDAAKSLKKIGDFLVDQKSLTTKYEVSDYEKYVSPKYLEAAIKK